MGIARLAKIFGPPERACGKVSSRASFCFGRALDLAVWLAGVLLELSVHHERTWLNNAGTKQHDDGEIILASSRPSLSPRGRRVESVPGRLSRREGCEQRQSRVIEK